MSKKSTHKAPAQTPKRTPDEIKTEYANVRAQLGEEHLKMRVAESTRDNLTQRLVNLHNEYNQLTPDPSLHETTPVITPEVVDRNDPGF